MFAMSSLLRYHPSCISGGHPIFDEGFQRFVVGGPIEFRTPQVRPTAASAVQAMTQRAVCLKDDFSRGTVDTGRCLRLNADLADG